MRELTFIVTEDEDGGFNARAADRDIFAQGDSREDLTANVRDAVRCHFGPGEPTPDLIHLHYVHDEVVAL